MANGNQLATLLGQGATMSPSGQTQIDLARSLASGAIGGGPVRGGPIEALSRVGQAFFARKLMEQQQEEQSQRQERVQDTLSRALSSRTGGQPGSARQPSPQEISQVLMGTPETAPMGAQIGLSQALQGQEPTRQTISGDQANQLFGTSLAPGAAVTVERGPQGLSVIDVESPKSPSGKAVNVLLPDSEQAISGIEDDQGRLFIRDEEGNRVRAPRGARKVGLSVQAQETGDLSGGKTQVRNFQKLERTLPVVNRLQQRINEGLESGEFVGGVTGGTLKLVNSFRNQVSQLYSAFNKDKPAEERDVELSVDRFRDDLGSVMNMSTQVQSAVLDLAYMTLKAKGEEKVSDQDIRKELDSYGLDTNDPNVIMNQVNNKIGDLYANYNTFAEQLGVEPMFQFNPNQGGGGGVEISPEDEALINKYTGQ